MLLATSRISFSSVSGHRQQVVADQRVFDGPRLVDGSSRKTARHGATESASGTATQRCGCAARPCNARSRPAPPARRRPAAGIRRPSASCRCRRSCPAPGPGRRSPRRRAAARPGCRPWSVWSFSITSSTARPVQQALQRARPAAVGWRKPPIAIFRRGAPKALGRRSDRAPAQPDPAAIVGPKALGAGIDLCSAGSAWAIADSSASPSSSSSPRTSTPSAPACCANWANQSWPWRRTSAAPNDDKRNQNGRSWRFKRGRRCSCEAEDLAQEGLQLRVGWPGEEVLRRRLLRGCGRRP